jgi:hypothetical protein
LILNISFKEDILTSIQTVTNQNTIRFTSLRVRKVSVLLVAWINVKISMVPVPLSMPGHVLRLVNLNRASGMIKPNLILYVQEHQVTTEGRYIVFGHCAHKFYHTS